MYITAPPVNYSILCLSSTVHIVAFVNLLLKKMVVVVVAIVGNCLFSARQHICYSALYAIARPSVCLSLCLSVCPSVCHTGGSVKDG